MAQIQAPTFTAVSAGDIRPRARFRVSKKLNWTDTWTVEPYLEVIEFTDAAAPSIPSATFQYVFGKIKREDRSSFTFYNALELRDWYVLIEQLPAGPLDNGQPVFTNGRQVDPIQRWVGRFTDQSLQTAGKSRSTRGVGREYICACGMAHELDKNVIASSVCSNDEATTIRVDEIVVFNDDLVAGYVETGNRSSGKITNPDLGGGPIDDSSYVFSNAKTTADEQGAGAGKPFRWSAMDIAEYLLTWHAPPGMKFKVTGATDTLAKIEPPEFRVAGCTVFEALNRLFDRRRGFTWSIVPPRPPAPGEEAGDDPDAFEVRVDTNVDEDVVFDDFTLPKNPNVTSIPVRSLEHLIKEHELRLDVLAAYDRIVVSGERMLVCCTVSFTDKTLEKAWDSDLENSYKAGKETSSINTSGWTNKQFDEARTVDYFKRVYTTFRIPKTWNFQAGNGTGGSKSSVIPSFTNDGRLKTDTAAPTRNWGHRITRHLPIREAQISGGAEKNVAPEYYAPFALIKNGDGRYQHSEKMVLASKDNPNAGHVRPLDDDFGFECSASPNHALAKGSWNSGATPAGTTFNPDAKGVDYRDILATVAFRTDARLRVIVDVAQSGGLSATGKPGRTLQLDVPNVELWWIAPNTVIRLKSDGSLDYKLPTGIADTRIIRDDSPRLRQIATLAKAWYGKRRAAMALTLHDASATLPVGTYVKAIQDVTGFETVNSVVTCVKYDVVNQTTLIQTQFAELDVTAGFGPSKLTLR